MKKNSILILAIILLTSCVSKKKYIELEHEKGEVVNQLSKTKIEKEELEAKFAKIEARVSDYNSKINTLTEEVGVLTEENQTKFDAVGNTAVMSEASKKQMRETLKKVHPSTLSYAKTLKDSMNLALSYNLNRFIDNSDIENADDISINIDETVVMITISDKMLFRSGSFKINKNADRILQKLASVINSEPSLDVMIEGHTDNKSIKNSRVADNWDLSVLRATSVVRKLQDDYGVNPAQMIASGRSSFLPLTNNDTNENRARNRRTRIVILPNIDKFFALMASN